MKTTNRSAATERNYFESISESSECKILNLNEMMCIRGGEGEGTGGEPIIIIPPINS
jgi:hypothetical protein